MAFLSAELLTLPTKTFRPVTRTIAQALLIIVTLSIFTTGYAILTLALSLKDAEAVNVAGSMRMQSYRLAFDIQSDNTEYELHLRQFEFSLFSDSMKDLNHWMVPDDIKADYRNIVMRWTQLIDLLESEERTDYLPLVSDFVSRIDSFVLKLQKYSEKKIKDLALVGGFGLGGIFIVSLFVVRFVRMKIVQPLGQLVIASEKIQHRNFDIDIDVKGSNELSILANTFTDMSKELFSMYEDLELAVENKTFELNHANQSLQVLYRSSSLLTDANISNQTFLRILNEVLSIEGVLFVRLIIDDPSGKPLQLEVGDTSKRTEFSKRLVYSERPLGQLCWATDGCSVDESLIASIALIFSRGIHYKYLQKQNDQLLIAAERTAIARELHDSLAQSLSYLKIQMTLLKRQLIIEVPNKTIKSDEIIEDIDNGIKSAYTQLRELLNTFRLTLTEANFGDAIKGMLEPIKAQANSVIVINNNLSSLDIDAPQQVHLLQIIREAVLNATKHASAKKIDVNCWHKNEKVFIEVVDDGVGFDSHIERINHYGLAIMRERAERLNAEFDIITRQGKGCKIALNFEQKVKGIDDDKQ
jgi:two-component system nitrate/nitrite sensor histidine kinase NarQ